QSKRISPGKDTDAECAKISKNGSEYDITIAKSSHDKDKTESLVLKALRRGIGQRCTIGEEVWILLLKLIFTFPCELRASPRVTSNLEDGNAALLQPLDLTIHNFH
ncbi:hypothetical protein Tco_0462925, partial [Tanacetum coccineum]